MIMPGMRVSSLIAAPLALLAACGPAASNSTADEPSAQQAARQGAETVQLRAADGVSVHAVHYAADQPRAVILLFHQANGSAAEYAPIAPRLAAAGFESLAIDQRSGGQMFGPNRTVAGQGRSSEFLAAEPDLEAALAWARSRKLPVIVWGSSYSAALVFRLASRHPGEIAGVVAFSPGEYLGAPRLVREAASRVTAPIFAAAASDAREQAAVRMILAASPSQTKTAYIPLKGGTHGSSTLDAARNPDGAGPAWTSITTFLDRLLPKSSPSAP